MIQVESYLKKGNAFIPIAQFREAVADPEHIEGAIELVIGDVPLLSRDMWDYVDQLWSYLVSGLCEVCRGNRVSTYFPDQPIEIIMTPMRSRREITVEVKYNEYQVPTEVVTRRIHRSASTDLQEFVEALTRAAGAFFVRMGELVPTEKYSYQIDLEKIRRIAETYRS